VRLRVVGLSVFGAGLLVAAGLGLFAFDFPRVGSNDMAPGVRKGDLLLACRVCGPPKVGDVVLFSSEDADERVSIRRVVALPGDEVEVKSGAVRVNGKPLSATAYETVNLEGLDEAPDRGPTRVDRWTEELGSHRYVAIRDHRIEHTATRPKEKIDGYFVLADRRTMARDSRDYGPIRKSSVRAIILRVLSAGDDDATRQTTLP
jgi:signal peptidase I